MYYELDSFYSNYRSLVTTLPLYKQLRGENIDESTDCQNVERLSDLLQPLSVYSSVTDTNELMRLPADTTYLNPCGILPKYIFSDSFTLHLNNIAEGSKINIAID